MADNGNLVVQAALEGPEFRPVPIILGRKGNSVFFQILISAWA